MNETNEQILNLLQEILKELKHISEQTTINTTVNISSNVSNTEKFMNEIKRGLQTRSGL